MISESHPRISLPPTDPAFDSDLCKRATDYLETTYPPAVIKLGLERITRLLELLGRPQDSFPSIIVAGTNGKGSTCAYLGSILTEAGLLVGTNLSPHLEQAAERIRIGRSDISPIRFAEIILNISALIVDQWGDGERPTYHELLTAAALVHFAECDIDIAILEVGLGGRYDAANAVDAPLAIITPIGLDHTDRLGNDIGSIAREKAAVVRPGATVICARQEPEAMDAINEMVNSVKPALILQPTGNSEVVYEDHLFRVNMHIDNIDLRCIPLGIGGACQDDNARTAIEAASALRDLGLPDNIDYDVDPDCIANGLTNARLPGRFEMIGQNPLIVLDGAHNRPGAKCLSSSIALVPDVKWHAVIGMKIDKDAGAFIREISSVIDVIYLCLIPDIKSYKPGVLAGLAKSAGIKNEYIHVFDNPGTAFGHAVDDAGSDNAVIITGSLYLVGYLRRFLRSGFDDTAARE